MVRTRIAPSPTGENLHIGNLYTALINFAFAKKNNGKFIIRIEDTDRERFVEGATEKILQSIHDFGITYDEGPDIQGEYAPYVQSKRLEIYKKHAEDLVITNNAYYCICTKERLDDLRKTQMTQKKLPKYDKKCLSNQEEVMDKIKSGGKFVVRLNVPAGQKIEFEDLIRGKIVFDTDNIDDQVLLKSDGYPTYHLGVVVDDYLMKISHVIRAEEWISSTPKHVLLYKAFGWNLPVFAHLPILRNADKSKLSKRKNPVWVSWYLDEGFLKEAVLNYLALMGWSHPDQRDIFSLEEFIDHFDLKDINPAGPIFDIVKLRWMNQQYIQNLTDETLIKKLNEYYKNNFKLDDNSLKSVMPLVRSRMETLKDFEKLTLHFYEFDKKDSRNEMEQSIRKELEKILNSISEWNKEAIMDIFRQIMKKYNIKMSVLYYLFTGEEKGLPLPETLEILGKEKSLSRL